MTLSKNVGVGVGSLDENERQVTKKLNKLRKRMITPKFKKIRKAGWDQQLRKTWNCHPECLEYLLEQSEIVEVQ